MKLFSDLPSDDGIPGAERRLAMIAIMLATAMAVFDGTIVNVALPTIARALNVPAAATVWVANGYLLAMAMSVVTFAALASRVGFRALFASGLAVFTLASLGCALSTSLATLTGMRLLQGLGGAAALSIPPAIYRTIFPSRLLGRALGINALLVAVATAIGPTLGGTLLAFLSWPWLFAINVPLGAAAVFLSLRVIPNTKTPTSEPFDIAGALLSALAMGSLILGADACAHFGSAGTGKHAGLSATCYAATAGLAGAAFIWRQRRARQPLLPLDVFTSTRFSLAALTSLVSFVGQGITFVALPFLLQNAYGYSPFVSALLFTSWPIGIIMAAPRAGQLADRYPAAVLSTAGLGLFTIGLALLALLPDQAREADILWRAWLCGVGFGIFQSPNNREMLSNVSRERSGNAAGVLAVVRTFGQCVGTALVGIILTAFAAHVAGSGTAVLTAAQDAEATRLALWLAAFAAAAATAVSMRRIHRPKAVREP